jgi:hypothetical protein
MAEGTCTQIEAIYDSSARETSPVRPTGARSDATTCRQAAQFLILFM